MNTSKLKSLMVNDEGFAFDPRTGNTYSMNATALFIVNCIKAGASHAEILEKLVGKFDIKDQAADRDLEVFFGELSRQKLVETGVAS